jgi:hypothetical protein
MSNMLKKSFFLLMFSLASAAGIFSISLEDLVDSQYAAALRSSETMITEVQLRNPQLRLLPGNSGLRRFINETSDRLNPNIMVETLSIYKKPSGGEWNEAIKTALFNQLTALSTLAGIQYYSASRNTMRTFYEVSHVIDNPENKNAAADPVYTIPPRSLSLYARQKDLTFGDNIYRYDYIAMDDAIWFLQENLTPMSYGIIQAVGRNRLNSIVAVLDTDDCLLIYVVSMAKTISVFGMGDRIGNSFRNRAEAVLKWFAGRADAVFAQK